MGVDITKIQENVPLSKSLLWELRNSAYQSSTFEDLLQIPHGPTSALNYVESVAELSLAFIRNGLANGDFAPNEPVYILETGSGTSVFALRFIRYFKSILKLVGLTGHIKFCYICTDGSQKFIDSISVKPDFKEYADAGEVDFGHIDLGNIFPMKLKNSGFNFGATSIDNPIIVISNYFFDCIPYDVFNIKNNKVFEVHESLYTPNDNYSDGCVKDIPKLVPRFEDLPVSFPHFNHPVLEKILEQYAEEYVNLTISLSLKSIEIIETIRDYSNGKMLHVSSDISSLWTEKGPSCTTFLPVMEKISWAPVNLNAFQRFADLTHAFSYNIQTACINPYNNFETLVLLHGADIKAYPDVRYQLHKMKITSYHSAVSLREWLGSNYENLNPDVFLTTLDIVRSDIILIGDNILLKLQDFISKNEEFRSQYNSNRVINILEDIYKNTPGYYPGADWIRFMIGNIATFLHEYHHSLRYYNDCNTENLRSEKNQWVFHYNKGIAFMNLGEYEKSLDAFNEAHTINPNDLKTLDRIVYVGQLL
ncbi:MAG TPA: tetratricopeptide repeat protein [Victivallales bacterium]|nr:tetratricopeptide repeat protein [Victivallales bacterium]